MKDSFLTIGYRDGFIHTCYNRETKQAEIQAAHGLFRKECKTITGAKRWITTIEGKKKFS